MDDGARQVMAALSELQEGLRQLRDAAERGELDVVKDGLAQALVATGELEAAIKTLLLDGEGE